MPTFSFKGFAAQSQVSLAATQNGTTQTGNVSNWGGILGNIGILTRMADHVFAPAAVWCEAVNIAGFNANGGPGPGEVYDPSFHEITYIWTVRGQPLGPFVAPQNMVAGWNNPNVMYGKKVVFHFAEAGSYTIDLWAVERDGITASAETTLIVGDEAAAAARYPAANTVVFSRTGAFSGAPAGAKQVTVSTPDDMRSESQGLSAPTRFLFRRGETFDDVRLDVGGALEYIGAFGSGDRPVLNANNENPILFGGSGAQHTIAGIDFRGDWDSTTETGTAGAAEPFRFLQSTTPNALILVSGCIFDGFLLFDATPGQNGGTGSRTIIADTVITNWRDYGLYTNKRTDDKGLAIVGTRIAQHVDALNGGPRNGSHNTQGPVRLSRIQNVVMAQCDFFSRCGWSGLPPDLADQPCIRLNSTPTDNQCQAVLDRVVCEGGFKVIVLQGENSAAQEYAGNYLLDRVLMIGTAKTSTTFIEYEYGGTTLRNILGIMPNVPDYHSTYWRGATRHTLDNPTAENENTRIATYNSTFVSLRDATNDQGNGWILRAGDVFNDVTEENNVLHAPDIDPPAVDADAPIDLATAIPGITPRYKGVGYSAVVGGTGTIDATYASPATLPLPRPEAGSAAIDDGDAGLKAYDDFLTTERPPAGNERGALLTN